MNDALITAWIAWDKKPGDPARANTMEDQIQAHARAHNQDASHLRDTLSEARRNGLTYHQALNPVDPAYLSAKVRHDARDTSRQAAAAILPRTGTARCRVLLAIADKPSTDEELQHDLAMKNSTQCPRRIECVESGWVQDSGQRRHTSSGMEAIVWELTPEGHQAARTIRP